MHRHRPPPPPPTFPRSSVPRQRNLLLPAMQPGPVYNLNIILFDRLILFGSLSCVVLWIYIANIAFIDFFLTHLCIHMRNINRILQHHYYVMKNKKIIYCALGEIKFIYNMHSVCLFLGEVIKFYIFFGAQKDQTLYFN